MKEKPSYYAVIPAEVRYNKNLTPNAKLLYAEITALAQKDGLCWASNKYFSDLYNVSTVTISRWISSLVENDFINRSITYKKGTKQIDKRYLQLCSEGINKNVKTPINKNVKDNNTSINITSINISIKEKFVNQVMAFEYPKDMLEDFINYWTEGKKKMRYQKQTTFEIKLRLLRWSKNEKKWNLPKKTMSKLDSQINAWQEAKKLL